MKHLFSIIAMALAAICAIAGCGQSASETISEDEVLVTGHIDGLKSGMIRFQDAFNNFNVIGKARVHNGDFTFRSEIAIPTHVYIYSCSGEELQLGDFYLEPGQITVSGSLDEILKYHWAVATGSPLNDYEREYDVKRSDRTLTDPERDSLFIGYVVNAPDYAIPLSLMGEPYDRRLPSLNKLKMIEEMPSEVQELQYVKDLKALLEQRMKVEPQVEGCDIVPIYIDIEEKDMTGTPVTLKSVVEKPGTRYVLVDFWATWCGPCREEIPYLVDAYKAFHGKGFDIYSVSYDPDRLAAQLETFIKDNGMCWTNVRMPDGDDHTYDDYALSGIPDNVLVDCSTGIIVGRTLRGEKLKEILAELLPE